MRAGSWLKIAARLSISAVVILFGSFMYYRYFSENAACWGLQDSGFLVLCAPRIPDSTWILAMGAVIAGAAGLILAAQRLRTSR